MTINSVSVTFKCWCVIAARSSCTAVNEVAMFWPLISRFLHHFVSLDFGVTLLTWLSIAVGAALTFLIRTDHGNPKTFTGFLRFCFPPEMFTSRSCRVDCVYWVLNRLAIPLIIAPLLVGSIVCSTLSYQGLNFLFGLHSPGPGSLTDRIFVMIVATVGADFATFYTHYLDHKIAVMWEFHKVHHSPEFLIPLTNKRFHPVQEIFDQSGVVLTTGLLMGVCSYVLSMPIYENTIAGIDVYFLVNALSFYHLRHSHINMSYGWLEKWLLSPAQHQLHHSQEGRHWDKNFGLLLSVWDLWFGTLLYSEPRGSFRLGLPGAEGGRFQTIPQLYFTPFINIVRMAQNRLRSHLPSPHAEPAGEPSQPMTTR
jgi:sterol desaturase/sphingolipid hydroxylase (fatty acid hydroxylase superfamily)